MRFSVVFSVTVIVLVCLAAGDENDCKPEIKFSGKDVYQFDLTGLRHKKGQIDYMCMDGESNSFYFNVCGELSSMNKTGCEGAAVCQETPTGVIFNAGTFVSQKFEADYESGPGRGIIIHYGNGTSCSDDNNRHTMIFIECDETADIPVIQPAETENCSFAFHLTSKYGCGKKIGGPNSSSNSSNVKQICTGLIVFIMLLSLL